MTRAMACPSITLSKVTLFAQQMEAFFEQEKFRGHGKKGVTGFLNLKAATTSSAAFCEILGGAVFASCFGQVNVAEGQTQQHFSGATGG